MSFFRSTTLRRALYGLFLLLALTKLVALSHAAPAAMYQAHPPIGSTRL